MLSSKTLQVFDLSASVNEVYKSKLTGLRLLDKLYHLSTLVCMWFSKGIFFFFFKLEPPFIILHIFTCHWYYFPRGKKSEMSDKCLKKFLAVSSVIRDFCSDWIFRSVDLVWWSKVLSINMVYKGDYVFQTFLSAVLLSFFQMSFLLQLRPIAVLFGVPVPLRFHSPFEFDLALYVFILGHLIVFICLHLFL